MAGDTRKGARKPAQASAGRGKQSKPKKPPAELREEVNARQHLFAIIHGGGTPAGRAYEQAGFSVKGDAADACAARLLRNVKVRSIVESVRAKAIEKAEESAVLTLIEKRQFLAKVVRTAIGQVGPDSVLCQEYTKKTLVGGDDEQDFDVEKVKMPCKMRALELDAKLAGELSEKGDVPPPPLKPAEEEIAHGRAVLERYGGNPFAPQNVRGTEAG